MRILAFIAGVALCALSPCLAQAQEISGNFAGGSVKVGDDSATCNAGRYGAIRFNTNKFQGCSTGGWVDIGTFGGSSADNLGSHTATQLLSMANFKISNLGAPTLSADAATKAYVDSQVGAPYADDPVACPTAGSSCPDGTKYSGTIGIYNYFIRSTGVYAAATNAAATASCDAATDNSNSDWYMPSLEELRLVYTNRVALGIANAPYWSSDIGDEDLGTYMTLNFTDGSEIDSAANTAYVCIRKAVAGTTTTAKIWDNSLAGKISYTGGLVGIGTSAPTSALHVVGSAYTTGNVTAGGVLVSNSGINLMDSNGAAVLQVIPASTTNYSDFRMFTTVNSVNQNWWRWIAYGPSYSATSYRNDLRLLYTDYTNNSGTSKDALYFAHSGSNVYVGIGMNAPTYRLSLPDSASTAGRGVADAWIAYSDGRFKTDIEPIANAMDKIQQIEGVTYRSIQGEHPEQNAREVGFIAQDVRKVLPEAVVVTEGKVNINGQEKTIPDYHSLAYDRITALLVQGMKELKAENDELKKRLDAIEDKNGSSGQ